MCNIGPQFIYLHAREIAKLRSEVRQEAYGVFMMHSSVVLFFLVLFLGSNLQKADENFRKFVNLELPVFIQGDIFLVTEIEGKKDRCL